MKKKYLLTSLVLAGAFTSTVSLNAFKPTETNHGHKKITLGVLDVNYNYGSNSLEKFKTKLNNGREESFTPEAADHVYQGNRSTDQFWASFKVKGEKIDLVGELSEPTAHCDDELIDQCRKRIKDLKESVIKKLRNYIADDDPQKLGHARGDLGKAIHTIQDFYAHSNYADLNNDASIYQPLTQISTISSWSENTDVCEPREISSLKPLGGFSSNGGNFRLFSKGLDKSQYTTGYFTHRSFGGISTASDTNGSKCDHGVEVSGLWLSGISKDLPYAPLDDDDNLKDRVQPTLVHNRASNQAAHHTKEFLNLLISDIRKVGSAEDQDKMIKALLGIEDEPVYGFIIDSTGSMSSIITGVKNQIQSLINRVMSDSTKDDSSVQERQFLMVSFNDPDVGEVNIGNAEVIKNAVGSLSADGGGDCPEKANTGILKAVKAAPSKSRLFVFTDASSNDGELAGQIASIAKEKEITINYAVSGSCSPIDPSYYAVANATGGQVILVDHTSSSVEAAFTTIDIDNSSTTTQPVLITSGQTNLNKSFEIDVEKNADRLSILANSSVGAISFLSPSGEVVASSKIQINNFIGGKGLKVSNPEAGKWIVQLNTTDQTEYNIRADISSETYIKSVKFLDPVQTGKFEHEGYQIYGNEPVLGNNRLEVVFSKLMSEANAKLIKADGSLIKEVKLRKEDDVNFAGTVDVTSDVYRVVVIAKDSAGQNFERIYGAQIDPRNFLLELVNTSDLMLKGSAQMRFKIKNFGDQDTYTIEAVSDIAKIESIKNQSFSLEKNAENDVFINVSVGDADVSKLHNIVIKAKNSKGQQQTFTHSFELDVDTDEDGISDQVEQSGYGEQLDFDGNGDGIADWKQANVVSMFSRQKRGYFTYAVPTDVQFSKASSISLENTKPENYIYDLAKFTLKGKVKDGVKVDLYIHNHVLGGAYHAFDNELKVETLISNSSALANKLSFTLKNNDVIDLSPEDDLIMHIGGLKNVQFSIHQDNAQENQSKKKSGGGSLSIGFLASLLSLALLRRRFRK